MKRCFLFASATLLLGCGGRTEQFVRPDQITDFAALYDSNCAGCHGREGRPGAARPLNDPLFLAVIGKPTLRDVIAKGVPGTGMPGFAQNAGGSLTDQQITILADQIDAHWSRPQAFVGAVLPPYRAAPGDPKAGEHVFHTHCAGCHGENGAGGPNAGSVIDPAFLALVSDQSLRTTVIAGRINTSTRERENCSRPNSITPQEVSDVVAWLSAHRSTPVPAQQRGI